MHTPGPWKYNKERSAIVSETAWLVEPSEELDTQGIPLDVLSLYGAMGGEDTQADARLIAAAPDMLAILKHLYHNVDGQIDMKTWKNIIDAIEKAEG